MALGDFGRWGVLRVRRTSISELKVVGKKVDDRERTTQKAGVNWM
ncbi:hypothetical protein RR48_12431 [Papilio machaon]|uniref:Uncharacterized protein n=1 Tax=Papilio machaon TaxID=76193 RepID=A0A194RNL6_PAPMA|nr:hypothetical protein RR48_12431 [Papilio machaon]